MTTRLPIASSTVIRRCLPKSVSQSQALFPVGKLLPRNEMSCYNFSSHSDPLYSFSPKSASTTESSFRFFSTNQNAVKSNPLQKTHNRKRKQSSDGPLVNEHLIRSLMEDHDADDSNSIQIRLMVDRGRDIKAEVKIVSLTEAISISVEEVKDLVEINLNQDIPVVKCIDYKKFMYEQSKKGGMTSGGGNKATKQFSYKAGIEDDDLQRKVRNMVEYLQKGHPCQVTITSNRRNLKDDQNAVETTLERIVILVGEDGSPQGNLKKNDYNNRGSLLIQPSRRK